jgi:uncharacterized membrane protein YedE/YeeE
MGFAVIALQIPKIAAGHITHHTTINCSTFIKNIEMPDFISQPWPWYVAGPLIGLTVPALLLIGNKHFGISSSLRHICAACIPADISYFKYEWKREAWNLFFVGGIIIGGFIASQFLSNTDPILVSEKTTRDLDALGITVDHQMMPTSIFNADNLFTTTGFIFFVAGGFLVGFGTRYAGGCTSGHSIMGLSTLQLPSLIATCCFMIGGLVMAHLIFPWIMSLI